jgi:hypothetical protein
LWQIQPRHVIASSPRVPDLSFPRRCSSSSLDHGSWWAPKGARTRPRGHDIGGTTGHGVDIEKAAKHARRALISALANPTRAAGRHTSQNEVDRPAMAKGEAWSFDHQEYARSVQGYKHVTTFVCHATGYLWATYRKGKTAEAMVDAVEKLIIFACTALGRTVKCLCTDSDPSALATVFRTFLGKQGLSPGTALQTRHSGEGAQSAAAHGHGTVKRWPPPSPVLVERARNGHLAPEDHPTAPSKERHIIAQADVR